MCKARSMPCRVLFHEFWMVVVYAVYLTQKQGSAHIYRRILVNYYSRTDSVTIYKVVQKKQSNLIDYMTGS